MSRRLAAWLKLGGALLLVAGAVAALHLAGLHAPGEAGRAYRNNTRRDIDTRALFYTEVGEVSEFFDAEHGRYGRIRPGR